MRTTSITVSSGGFLGLYMLGIVSHIKDTADLAQLPIGGVSAGAIVAGYLLSERCDEAHLRRVILPTICTEVATWSNTREAWRNVPTMIRNVLHEIPDIQAHRGFVAVSRISRRFPFVTCEIVEGFKSTHEYIDYAILSAFVPLLCGELARAHGEHLYVDGAITSRVPIPRGCDPRENLFVHPSMFGRQFTWRDCSTITPYRVYRLFALGRRDARRNHALLSIEKSPLRS